MAGLLGSGACWVKLCAYRFSAQGPPYRDTLPFTGALIAEAPERCLWGTDWPHIWLEGRTKPDDAELLGLLFESAPREDTRRMILQENPAGLYGFTD